MTQEKHWTEESADAFAHRIAFDFIAQIENRMEAMPMKQADLAQKLGISEGAVSKLLNNPQNLTIRTIAKYSRALGLKASILAYDDGDARNNNGPINSEVFRACWERTGKPTDMWAFDGLPLQTTTAQNVTLCNFININLFLGGFGNTAVQQQFATVAVNSLTIAPWTTDTFPSLGAAAGSTKTNARD